MRMQANAPTIQYITVLVLLRYENITETRTVTERDKYMNKKGTLSLKWRRRTGGRR